MSLAYEAVKLKDFTLAYRLPDNFGRTVCPVSGIPFLMRVKVDSRYYLAGSIRWRTSMPLSPPKCARQKVHVRQISVEGYRREDGMLELDACLTDTKEVDYMLASGVRKAGDPVHQMRVRVTLDADFTIVDAEACSDWVPYVGGCDTIGPDYRRLIGLNLVRGFRRTVGEMFADVRGCSHLTELLSSLPTAAIQTFATFRRDNEDSAEKPFQLDRCHALDCTGETVRLYYPKWYRAAPREE